MSARPRRAAAQAADIARQAARGAPVLAPGRSRGGKSLSISDAANTAVGVESSTPLQPGLTAAGTSEAVSASALDRGKRTAAPKAPSKRPAHTGASSAKASSPAPAAKRARKAPPKATPTSDATQSAPIATSPAAPAPTATSPARPSTTAAAAAHAHPHAPPPNLLPPTLSFSLPYAIAHLSRADPRFALMFAHVPIKPFAPPLEAIDPFRTLVTSIIGQQVSWMAARAINARFRGLFGYGDGTVVKSESGEGGVNVEVDEGYPSPEEVAGREVLELKSVGLSLRKAEYVQSLAQHFVSGALTTELLRDGTDEEVAKALIAVRGIGQKWTVDMFLMFSLRRPDVLPVGDLGVQKGLLRWFLAAHSALPQFTRVAKGKGKGKVKAEAEDGDGVVVKKEGKAAEAARKKYAPAPATPVTPMRMREEGTPVKLESVDDIDGLQDRRMVTPPPPITTARHVRGELDTLIATPPPSRQFGEDDDVEPLGKRYQLPPTPLTPGGTANTDSPDSTDAGASIVKIGALHTPITPAPHPSFGNSNGETSGRSLPQLPPTPLSPGPSVSVLAASSGARGSKRAAASAPVPVIPQETLEIPSTALPPPPPPSGDQLLHPPAEEWLTKEGLEWDAGNAAPMEEGLSVEVLKSRLSGKKVKGGAYLTPLEMERMTEHWKPYRSLGVYYMWPAGEEF